MGRFLTDPDCVRQREYVNIPAWHDVGYIGKGQTVFLDDKASDIGHIGGSMEIIKGLLPDADVLSGRINFSVKSGKVTDVTVKCNETGELMPFDDFVIKHNIGLINNSTDGGKGTTIMPHAIWMRGKIKEHNLIVTGAAGNGNGQPTTQRFNGACIVVTQCTLDNDKPRFANKAVGENIDFAMFSGYRNGTSFASPFLLGLCGLLRSKYPEITQDEAYDYLKNHCMDLGDKNKLGWGIPIMGSPQKDIKTGGSKVEYEKIQALLGKVPVEVDGRKEIVRTINYEGENWFRLRDYDEVLKIAEVDYDELRKLPIIKD